MNDRQKQKWPKIVMKKYIKARESDVFKIMLVDETKLDCFYIMIKISSGFYKGQTHILEFKTRYGSGVEYFFPFSPPLVKFITKIFHPNISVGGSVCVDILTEPKKWSAQYDFNAVINSILLLFIVPNNASPYNSEAAGLYIRCKKNAENTLNKEKVSLELEEEIYKNSFNDYIERAKQYAKTDITKYIKLFNDDELENCDNILTKMKIK